MLHRLVLMVLLYENLQWSLTKISASEILFVCGGFNSHIGKNADGYEGVHGGRGFGRRYLEYERILEFAVTYNLVVSNSFFTKRKSHLVIYQSGENQSQVGYILVKQVIPNEECVTQHNIFYKANSFSFNSIFYIKIHGCSMWRPTSSTYMKQAQPNTLVPKKSLFYRRFINDFMNQSFTETDHIPFRKLNSHSLKINLQIDVKTKMFSWYRINTDNRIRQITNV